jgi:hypothetical protein
MGPMVRKNVPTPPGLHLRVGVAAELKGQRSPAVRPEVEKFKRPRAIAAVLLLPSIVGGSQK